MRAASSARRSTRTRNEDDANHYLFVDAAQAFILPKSEVALFAGPFERHTAHLKRR